MNEKNIKDMLRKEKQDAEEAMNLLGETGTKKMLVSIPETLFSRVEVVRKIAGYSTFNDFVRAAIRMLLIHEERRLRLVEGGI